MRSLIEIAAAVLVVCCISVSSAAFAAGGKIGRSTDGLSCAFSGECFPCRTLRRDPQAMRRKIFSELLRRQDAVGDVSGGDVSGGD